jgi:hypothetical protein
MVGGKGEREGDERGGGERSVGEGEGDSFRRVLQYHLIVPPQMFSSFLSDVGIIRHFSSSLYRNSAGKKYQ